MRAIILKMKYKINEILLRKKWRKLNKHNFTKITRAFQLDIAQVGKGTYGTLNIYSYGSFNEKLVIGNFVSIGPNVTFLLGGNHNYNFFSTYPFKVKLLGEESEAHSNGPIIIEDDAWIGINVTLLSGIRIGKGSIVGAGSVVTRDVPPYAIAVGNPATVIKYRFSKEIINKLLKFNFSKVDDSFVNSNLNILYEPLSEEILDELNK